MFSIRGRVGMGESVRGRVDLTPFQMRPCLKRYQCNKSFRLVSAGKNFASTSAGQKDFRSQVRLGPPIHSLTYELGISSN